MNNVMNYIAYTAGAAFILLGIGILFTNIIPTYLPSQYKVIMGMVLFLYGIYRIVVTLFKQRQKDNEETN